MHIYNKHHSTSEEKTKEQTSKRTQTNLQKNNPNIKKTITLVKDSASGSPLVHAIFTSEALNQQGTV